MNSNAASARISAGRVLELLAVLVVSLSCIGLIAARLGIFDAPPVWIAGLLATYAYQRATSSMPIAGEDAVPVWHVVLIVGVGLLFRLTPDAYILGGQDQGVYVNTAMELARTGSLVPVDTVLEKISDPAALETYRLTNYNGASFLPGVYATSKGLVFQFYHVFPVWMALFGDGFGPDVAVYALTFLSLLSLLFFHRLAYLITGNANAGLAAALLLAVNPLHAFFSKFPVTEVPTLAFSLMAFSFLLTYWKRPEAKGAIRFVALSVMAMGCLFMTRISGFMYVPFVVAVSVLALVFDDNAARRKNLLLWAVLVLAAYAISVLYGLKWSAPYARDIYRLSFAMVLGTKWKLALLGCLGFAALAWFLVWFGSKRPATLGLMRKALAAGMKLLPVLGVAIAAIGLYKAYRLGYTDAYASDPWIGQRFKLSHQGVRSLLSVSLIASAVYMSPFILVASFFAAFRTKGSPLLSVLLLFVTCFFVLVVMLQGVIAYQPYYARYLLSEFVPYTILLVVCVWAQSTAGKERKSALLGYSLLLGGVYCAALSFAQLGKSEHEGVAESIDKMTSRFDRGDLILIDAALRSPGARELKTTLMYTMGLNVAIVTTDNIGNSNYLESLEQPYDDVYLLTADGGETVPTFREVDSVRFTEYAFKHGHAPPVSVWPRNDSRVRILKYDATLEGDFGRRLSFGQGRAGNAMLGSGWSTPESWGVWSSSTAAQIRFDTSNIDLAGQDIEITIFGRAYVTPQAPTQKISILIDGNVVANTVAAYPKAVVALTMEISAAQVRGGEHTLELRTPDAVSPQMLGYSTDSRMLAFGLERMTLDKAGSKPDSASKAK